MASAPSSKPSAATSKFHVVFGNNKTFHIWEEHFETYTAAWISFFSARYDSGGGKRIALRFICD